MPTCPRCHQAVDAHAVNCPHCRTSLKAFGHPGIELYRSTGDTYLCATCTYDEDDTCNFPQRPYAQECTLYHDRLQPSPPMYRSSWQTSLHLWFRRNAALLVFVGLIIVSFLWVL